MRRIIIIAGVLWLVSLVCIASIAAQWRWTPRLDAGMRPDLIEAIWEAEQADGMEYRWTQAVTTLHVPPGTTQAQLLLRARDTTLLTFATSAFSTTIPVERQRRWFTLNLAPQATVLELRAPTFAAANDGRQLGVILEALDLRGYWGWSWQAFVLSLVPPLFAWLLVPWLRFWWIGGVLALGAVLLLVLGATGWLVRDGATVIATLVTGLVVLVQTRSLVYKWLWAIPVGTVLLALGFAAAPLIPAHVSWGLQPFVLLPDPLTVLLPPGVLIAGLCLSRVSLRSFSLLMPGWVWVASSSCVFGGLALLLPVQHAEGDAQTILGYLESGMWVHWKQPLDWWLHAALTHMLKPFSTDAARLSYYILGALAGLSYGALAGLCTVSWTQSTLRRLLVLMVFGCAGYTLLFAGYVESYALVLSALLAYVWAAMRSRQTGQLLLPGFLLGLAIVLHPLALWAVPTLLLFLQWFGWQRTGRTLVAMLVPVLGLIVVFSLAGHGPGTIGANNDAPGGYDGGLFVPLNAINGTTEQYTLWSGAHWIAWINVLLLAAPILLALPALLQPLRSPDQIFLYVLCLGAWLWSFLWNPDLGPLQDWDLFSVAGLPAILLAAYMLATMDSHLARLSAPAWVGLPLAHVYSWWLLHL